MPALISLVLDQQTHCLMDPLLSFPKKSPIPPPFKYLVFQLNYLIYNFSDFTSFILVAFLVSSSTFLMMYEYLFPFKLKVYVNSHPGIEPCVFHVCCVAGEFPLTEPLGKPNISYNYDKMEQRYKCQLLSSLWNRQQEMLSWIV